MKNLIHNEINKIKLDEKKEKSLLESFKVFDIKEDMNNVDKLIINQYTKNTFYGPLNRWLINLDNYSLEEVAYFTSRFIHSLNDYACESQKYFEENTTLYRGVTMNLSTLLTYEKAKGKIIVLTSFTSTTLEKKKIQQFKRKKNETQFSVIYQIKNIHNKERKSGGIDIQELSDYPSEKEILFLPFSFFRLTDVTIDVSKREAEIKLETIEKKEILEEPMKKGNRVQYNEKINIIELVADN